MGRWYVDVRGGCIGIYYAEALVTDYASSWPEPCLRIDGERVLDVGGFADWKLPVGAVRFAAGVALALDTAGIAAALRPMTRSESDALGEIESAMFKEVPHV